MYKAKLCGSQEIPPHRSRCPCSELLCGASKGALATSAQVSGKQGVCKQTGALREQNGAGGLRNPALTAAVRSRAALLAGQAAAHRRHAGATDPITSHTCLLSLQRFLVKSNCTKLQLDFLQC